MPQQNVLLSMRGITKSFPGVRALDGVDFDLRAGEIHCLMGENGAGKSTLIKVMTGVYAADQGTIELDGKRIAPKSPAQAQADGISTVYQEVNLIPELSVAENIYLGRQPRRFHAVDWKRMNALAREAVERLGLQIDVAMPLRSYSVAIQQMVAIARAVDIKARVLVLDEPTSSLDQQEVAQLFNIMRRLKEQGLGIIFVTHFIDQVYAVSDTITVLRNGTLVGSYAAAELPRIKLVSAMIGREMTENETRERCPAPASEQPVVLDVRGLGKSKYLNPVDIEVRRGEILGLAGLLGSGRSELAHLIFGLTRADRGSVVMNGRRLRFRSPRRSLRAKMGMLPENRREQSILPRLSIRENIILSLQARRGWWMPISGRRARKIAAEYIKSLHIATPDAEKPIEQLSGGNQQKVILGRWLASNPHLLILDEPTRGVDVGAKAEIAGLVEQLCADGLALVFISSELDELVRGCHRVAVMNDRRKVAELSGEEVESAGIMKAMATAHEGH